MLGGWAGSSLFSDARMGRATHVESIAPANNRHSELQHPNGCERAPDKLCDRQTVRIFSVKCSNSIIISTTFSTRRRRRLWNDRLLRDKICYRDNSLHQKQQQRHLAVVIWQGEHNLRYGNLYCVFGRRISSSLPSKWRKDASKGLSSTSWEFIESFDHISFAYYGNCKSQQNVCDLNGFVHHGEGVHCEGGVGGGS